MCSTLSTLSGLALTDIRAVARAGEPGEHFWVSGKQCKILLISRRPNFTKFWIQHVDHYHDESFRNRMLKIVPYGSFFDKTSEIWFFFNILRLQAAITPRWLQIDGNLLPNDPYGKSSFHSYRWNQFKVIPLACTVHTRNLPQIFCDVRRRLTAVTHSVAQAVTNWRSTIESRDTQTLDYRPRRMHEVDS